MQQGAGEDRWPVVDPRLVVGWRSVVDRRPVVIHPCQMVIPHRRPIPRVTGNRRTRPTIPGPPTTRCPRSSICSPRRPWRNPCLPTPGAPSLRLRTPNRSDRSMTTRGVLRSGPTPRIWPTCDWTRSCPPRRPRPRPPPPRPRSASRRRSSTRSNGSPWRSSVAVRRPESSTGRSPRPGGPNPSRPPGSARSPAPVVPGRPALPGHRRGPRSSWVGPPGCLGRPGRPGRPVCLAWLVCRPGRPVCLACPVCRRSRPAHLVCRPAPPGRPMRPADHPSHRARLVHRPGCLWCHPPRPGCRSRRSTRRPPPGGPRRSSNPPKRPSPSRHPGRPGRRSSNRSRPHRRRSSPRLPGT